MSLPPPADPGPSLRWLLVTIVLGSLVGVMPLEKSLYALGVPSAVRLALRCQLATVVPWLLVARPIARRWSLADSEAGALGGLALLALATTGLNAWLVQVTVRPGVEAPVIFVWLELVLSLLPTHVLMLGGISLVGSWTSARRLQRRAAEREAVLSATVVRAELEALRTRLQPHFVLNALNTVVGLARRGDGDRAADVAVDLGELLRFAVVEAGDDVSFDAEREIVERYLAIEQARFGDRLRVTWALDPAARTTRLPALLWQPLVENAIRHGLARRESPGTLRLAAHREAGALRLVVDADGPTPAASPPAAHPDVAPMGGLGLGLSTVQRRLALLYGEAAQVTLTLRDGGSRTELRLPVRT